MNAEGEIRPLRPEEVPEAAALVRESFATVAEEFGITEENAPPVHRFRGDGGAASLADGARQAHVRSLRGGGNGGVLLSGPWRGGCLRAEQSLCSARI